MSSLAEAKMVAKKFAEEKQMQSMVGKKALFKKEVKPAEIVVLVSSDDDANDATDKKTLQTNATTSKQTPKRGRPPGKSRVSKNNVNSVEKAVVVKADTSNIRSTRKRYRPLSPDISPMPPLPTKKIYNDLTRRALFNCVDENSRTEENTPKIEEMNDSFYNSFHGDDYKADDDEEIEAISGKESIKSSQTSSSYQPGQAIQKIFDEFNLKIEAGLEEEDDEMEDVTNSSETPSVVMETLRSSTIHDELSNSETLSSESPSSPNDYYEYLSNSSVTTRLKLYRKGFIDYRDILRCIQNNSIGQ